MFVSIETFSVSSIYYKITFRWKISLFRPIQIESTSYTFIRVHMKWLLVWTLQKHSEIWNNGVVPPRSVQQQRKIRAECSPGSFWDESKPYFPNETDNLQQFKQLTFPNMSLCNLMPLTASECYSFLYNVPLPHFNLSFQ